ncbi:hypothetical protein D3C80_1652660 [compost metagenome]
MARLEQLAHFLAQLFAQLVVEVDQRFVEQDQLRVLDQRPGHGRALLLTTGEFEGMTLEELLDAQHLRGFQHFALDLFVGHPGLS